MDQRHSGFRRVRLSSDSGADYRSIFENEYSGTGLTASGDAEHGTAFEYTIAGDGDVSIRTMRSGGGRRTGVIGPRSDHVVFWLSEGRIELDFGAEVRVVEPGAPTIVSASESYRYQSDSTRYSGVHLDDGFVRAVARDLGIPTPPGPLLFEQQDDVVLGLAPLRTLIREVGARISDARTPDVERTALNRRIAAVVLDTFPLRNPAGPRSADRLAAALRLIRANVDRSVALPEIAAGLGMSPRALQELFRRTLGTTPMRYLTDLRFEQVRRELLGADATTRVSAVARRWRFGNLGRFAAAYQERFDELPAETLRRAALAGGRDGGVENVRRADEPATPVH